MWLTHIPVYPGRGCRKSKNNPHVSSPQPLQVSPPAATAPPPASTWEETPQVGEMEAAAAASWTWTATVVAAEEEEEEGAAVVTWWARCQRSGPARRAGPGGVRPPARRQVSERGRPCPAAPEATTVRSCWWQENKKKSRWTWEEAANTWGCR